jgi:hypothetical protein
MEVTKRDEKVGRAIEYIRAQRSVVDDARQRAQGLRPAQPHDRDLISQYPEWEIAERSRERKARER